MFSPLLFSLYVYPFHEQQNHGWHDPVTFDFQSEWVRISIYFAAKSRLTWSQTTTFSQSGCVYPFNSRRTFMANIFPPLLFSLYVFPFHEQQNHGWHFFGHFWLGCHGGCVYPFNSRRTFMADMFPPLLAIRECVFPFHKQYNHCWYVSAHFSTLSKYVLYFINSKIMTDFFLPLLTLSVCVFPFWFSAQLWLTCSCHFRLSGSA